MNADSNWLRDQIHKLRARTDKPFGVNVMLMSPFADQVAQVVIDERGAGRRDGCRQSHQVHEGLERRRHQGHPGRCLGGAGASRGASWGHRRGCRRHRIGWTYWRDIDDGARSAGCRRGRCPRCGSWRYRRWSRRGSGLYAGRRWRPGGNTLSGRKRVHRIRTVQRAGAQGQDDTSTRATGRSTGHPVRALKSPFTNAYAKNEAAGASPEELGAMGTGALRKAAKDGNYEEGSFLCGQVAGMVNERQSAREIVDDLVDGAERVLKGASTWVA